jgi:hypothetical protein
VGSGSPDLFIFFDYLLLFFVVFYICFCNFRNGKLTVVPKDDRYRNVIGQRAGMSDGDVERINRKYECRRR